MSCVREVANNSWLDPPQPVSVGHFNYENIVSEKTFRILADG